MTISDEAIEAAINALYPNGPNEFVRKGWELTVRTILEAAAPFIRAQALEDAADDFENNVGVSEFAGLSQHDGTYWAHIDKDWEHQGPYMDWLRARAAAERGGE